MSGAIAVTGAKGFVGGHLLAWLGSPAISLDVDVTDAGAVAQAVDETRPESVVHLAAASSVAASWTDAGEPWRVNALGTVNLLDAVRSYAPQARVLVVSTGDVYGQADELPTPETAPFRPTSPYAASKAAAELAADQFARAGSDVVVVRAFQHEGPGRDERFAVGSWAAQLARAEEAGGGTVLVGDLSPRRDITDVRDVIRAYEALLDPTVPAGTYNVASGTAVAMRDVLHILVSLARCTIKVEEDPSRFRTGDVTEVRGDPSKLRAATDWAPTIPLEQTLADTLDAARSAVAEKMASA
ncbi:MAG TPA: GDP-mannose 4,6-dehydratase [Gaiellaceae bacterium]|nr:GDP-mannose 4,6-dehydratase [Gaiellaceae bacterium]